ncbi:hypothetical protein ACLOJK_009675 [Asimina triloba]
MLGSMVFARAFTILVLGSMAFTGARSGVSRPFSLLSPFRSKNNDKKPFSVDVGSKNIGKEAAVA